MKKSSNKETRNVNLEKLRSSIKLDFKQVDLRQIIKCEMENFGLQLGLIVIEQFMQAEVEQLIGPDIRESEMAILAAGALRTVQSYSVRRRLGFPNQGSGNGWRTALVKKSRSHLTLPSTTQRHCLNLF